MITLLKIALIIIAGFLIYSNTFANSFHLDDLSFIIDNPAIKSIRGIKSIFDYWPTRFIGFFSFAINYHIHKFRVFGYHIGNISLHVLTAVLLFWFVNLIFSTPGMRFDKISENKKNISFFAALIFLAHPIQSEAVNYIFQRVTIIAAIFYLSALCFYIHSALLPAAGRKFYYCLSLAAASAGIFTKEIIATLPLMLLACELFFLREGKGMSWKRIAPFFILPIVIPLIIYVYKPVNFTDIARLLDNPSVNSRLYLFTQFRVLVTYLRLLILPLGQNIDYDYHASAGLWSAATLISFLVLVFILAGAVRLYSRYRLLSFGIICFFISLLTESSIVPLYDFVFEHRLYLSMAGYSIFLVGGVYYYFKYKYSKTTVYILIFLVMAYSVLTLNRNWVWRDELSLWNDAVKKSPYKVRPYNERGLAYFDTGEYDRAIFDFTQALRLNPDYADGYYNRAIAYQAKKDYVRALSDYSRAIEKNPGYRKAYLKRGKIYYFMHEYEKASLDFKQILRMDSGYGNADSIKEETDAMCQQISNLALQRK